MPPSFNSQMIAEMIQGTIVGDPTVTVNGFAKIEEAKSGDLAFLGNEKYANYLSSTQASIIIMSRRLFNEDTKPRHATIILVDEAYQAMNTLLEAYQALTSQQVKNEIHSSAVVEENTSIAADVHVGPLCVISQGSSIGAQTMLVAQVYIGRNVRIGSGTTIHPGVRILDNCTIGNNVIIHANAVIGADGFGYVPTPNGGYKKTPQLGAVVIEDWVEIGANTTIDRASLGNTLIQEGVKIDNLVQVAHNVQIGAHTAIAAQAGISGSTKIGEHSIIGGQAGIVGHIQLAEGTKINAQSGVTKTIKEKNTAWTGSPAGPYQETLRNQLLSRKLSDLFRKVEELTAALKQKNED